MVAMSSLYCFMIWSCCTCHCFCISCIPYDHASIGAFSGLVHWYPGVVCVICGVGFTGAGGVDGCCCATMCAFCFASLSTRDSFGVVGVGFLFTGVHINHDVCVCVVDRGVVGLGVLVVVGVVGDFLPEKYHRFFSMFNVFETCSLVCHWLWSSTALFLMRSWSYVGVAMW